MWLAEQGLSHFRSGRGWHSLPGLPSGLSCSVLSAAWRAQTSVAFPFSQEVWQRLAGWS